MGVPKEWEDVFRARGMIPDGRATPPAVPDVLRMADAAPVPPAGPKYRNRKVEVDGFVFDSKKESRRWLDLREELRAGRISELRRQVGFPVVVEREPICEYVADFVYVRDGRRVVEDVKSAHTRKLPVYRIKRKLMKAVYGIEIVEV